MYTNNNNNNNRPPLSAEYKRGSMPNVPINTQRGGSQQFNSNMQYTNNQMNNAVPLMPHGQGVPRGGAPHNPMIQKAQTAQNLNRHSESSSPTPNPPMLGGSGGQRQSSWQSSRESIQRRKPKLEAGAARLEAIFREFDEDNSGFISAMELRKSLKEKFNLNLDHDNALLLLQRCDENNDGEISLEEFCQIIELVLAMKKSFDEADLDGSNAISKAELTTLMSKMNLPLTPKHVDTLIDIFDDDGSGEIEYQEFFNLILYVRELEYQYSKRSNSNFNWISKLLGQSTANDQTLIQNLSNARNLTFDQFFTFLLEALSRNKTRKMAPRVMKVRKPRKKAPKRSAPTRRPTLHAPPAPVKKMTMTTGGGGGSGGGNNSNVSPMSGGGGGSGGSNVNVSNGAGMRYSNRSDYQKVVNNNVYTRMNPFVDMSFPANASVLGKAAHKVTCWKRPIDIVPNPRLFVDGVEEGDVVQGSLGDCWFLGAVSVVATSGNEFIENSFVSSDLLGGRHVLKFFKDGKWVEVEVDDLIPCNHEGKPAFATCRDPNEFWVPIMEKAYAKLHGGYAALESGSISYALKDLTGEAVEELRLDEPDTLPCGSNRHALWNLFVDNLKESFLMGCSIISPAAMAEEKNSYDLLLNHAYGIIDCQSVQGNRLVRLRNPWGNFEWNGRWSDGAPEWTPELLAHFGNYEFDNDGTFFMCFEDFVQFFNSIHVLRLLTDDVGEVWDKVQIESEWNSQSAGGFLSFPTWTMNPQLSITPTVPNTRVFMCISQDDIRYHRKQTKYESMGMTVVKGDHNTSAGMKKLSCRNDEKVKTSIFLAARDNSLEFLASSPATSYVVIPSLYRPHCEAAFNVMIYSQHPVRITILTSQSAAPLIPSSQPTSGIMNNNNGGGGGGGSGPTPAMSGGGGGGGGPTPHPGRGRAGGVDGGAGGVIAAPVVNSRFNGEWKAASAGGCLNHDSWINNPQFVLSVSQSNTDVTIALLQDDSIQPLDYIGFYLFEGKALKGYTINAAVKPVHRVQMTNLVEVSSTVKIPDAFTPYYIMPCTFDPKKERKFNVSAFANGQLVPLYKAKDWTQEASRGEWTSSLAGGSMNHNTWKMNPRFSLILNGNGKLQFEVYMRLTEPMDNNAIGFYLFADKQGDGQPNIMHITAQSKFTKTMYNSLHVTADPGKYILLACTFVPKMTGQFMIGIVGDNLQYRLSRIA